MALHVTAEGYSQAVANYEAGRPDYPAALVSALPLFDARVVVELGAGTGKFTRLLLPQLADGADFIAVEPVAEMAASLARALNVRVLNRTASDTGLTGGATDVVVCAQAFHWFDDEASVAEIARILRPGGGLALIWNTRDDRVPWVGALSRLVDAYAADTPRHQTKRWQWILRDPRFGFDQELSEDHPHTTPREGVYARVLSTSFIAKLPEAEKQTLRRKIDDLLHAHGLDGEDQITMPYVSRLYVLTRR